MSQAMFTTTTAATAASVSMVVGLLPDTTTTTTTTTTTAMLPCYSGRVSPLLDHHMLPLDIPVPKHALRRRNAVVEAMLEGTVLAALTASRLHQQAEPLAIAV